VVIDVNQLLVGHVGGVYAHLLGDDEAYAPLGALAPVCIWRSWGDLRQSW
jgi:hypothetical protein